MDGHPIQSTLVNVNLMMNGAVELEFAPLETLHVTRVALSKHDAEKLHNELTVALSIQASKE